jgi:RNA polymerase sigma factor (sigma-70 family)
MVQDVTTLPDLDLVRNIKENACSDSFNELSSRHSNLFYKVCQSYIKVLATLGYHPTDIFEEKSLILFEAVSKYDPNRGAMFSTWLGNYARFFCLNKINRAKGIPEAGSEEEMQAVFDTKAVEDYETNQAPVNMEAIFKTLEAAHDTRIINIFRLRYDPNLTKKRTWANIAAQLKLTVQTTIQLHKKGLKLLRDEITKERLDVFQDVLQASS